MWFCSSRHCFWSAASSCTLDVWRCSAPRARSWLDCFGLCAWPLYTSRCCHMLWLISVVHRCRSYWALTRKWFPERRSCASRTRSSQTLIEERSGHHMGQACPCLWTLRCSVHRKAVPLDPGPHHPSVHTASCCDASVWRWRAETSKQWKKPPGFIHLLGRVRLAHSQENQAFVQQPGRVLCEHVPTAVSVLQLFHRRHLRDSCLSTATSQ
mmetsp:Transcript_153997/g.492332  ORF Transcript_153997/g.492332 Transcript_153997/m.492332 type:complete len:211 (+) Transcript_153997:251-883(+)